MVRRRALYLTTLIGVIAVIISMSLPFTGQKATGQPLGATELAYDDGIPYKTVTESEIACPSCIEYQGVRFGLGGVEIAAVTSVRFYASVPSTTYVYVHVTDVNQDPLLPDPVYVPVSRNGWYVVPIPETTVTGDFYVWIRSPGLTAFPMHDIQRNAARSFKADEIKVGIYEVVYGDLMIRASVRAEIHVGKDVLPNGQFKYKYQTIQEAVNDAGPLLTIIVHPGTYTENVMVNKQISIISSDGASTTFVESSNPSADVFNITSDGVVIEGFTIRGGAGDQTAGVRLSDVTKCLVANNSISNNYYGVYIADPAEAGGSRQNVVLQNVASSNTHGIWVGGQQNNICGNLLEGNMATEGSGIYLSEGSADNFLRFNSLNSDPAASQAIQVYYNGFFKNVDAVENWWGDASGPYHYDNPGGSGAAAGEMIDFSPWLGAAPVNVATAIPDVTDYVLDARAEASTTVTLDGSGDPIIWVASYAANPAAESAGASLLRFIDVCFSDTGSVDGAEIRVYYTPQELGQLTEGSLQLYWWNGSEWEACSNQKLYKSEDCVRATITAESKPGLSNLAGTPFALGATLDSGGGFQWWWLLVVPLAIIGLFVVVILGRILVRAISGRGTSYDYE